MLDTNTSLVEFTAHDRCDGCGARALTLARKSDQPTELLFCMHHRKESYENLLDEGWEIIDDYAAFADLADGETALV